MQFRLPLLFRPQQPDRKPGPRSASAETFFNMPHWSVVPEKTPTVQNIYESFGQNSGIRNTNDDMEGMVSILSVPAVRTIQSRTQ